MKIARDVSFIQVGDRNAITTKPTVQRSFSGGNVTLGSFRDEHEEVSHRAVPWRTAGYRAAGDGVGNPEIGGSTAIEIQRLADRPSCRLAAGECLSECGEGAWAAATRSTNASRRPKGSWSGRWIWWLRVRRRRCRFRPAEDRPGSTRACLTAPVRPSFSRREMALAAGRGFDTRRRFRVRTRNSTSRRFFPKKPPVPAARLPG